MLKVIWLCSFVDAVCLGLYLELNRVNLSIENLRVK